MHADVPWGPLLFSVAVTPAGLGEQPGAQVCGGPGRGNQPACTWPLIPAVAGCPFAGLPAVTPGFPWSRLSRKTLNLSAVDSPAPCASRILPARNQRELWDVACEQVSTDVVPVW